MVTTKHQKLPKMGQNSIKRFFFCPKGEKSLGLGRSPPQELEVGPRRPYLLVPLKAKKSKKNYEKPQKSKKYQKNVTKKTGKSQISQKSPFFLNKTI